MFYGIIIIIAAMTVFRHSFEKHACFNRQETHGMLVPTQKHEGKQQLTTQEQTNRC